MTVHLSDEDYLSINNFHLQNLYYRLYKLLEYYLDDKLPG